MRLAKFLEAGSLDKGRKEADIESVRLRTVSANANMGKAKRIAIAAAYWLMSCTWGLLYTLVGALTVLVALCLGGKPERNGTSTIIRIGKGWGGVSLGAFALCSEDSGEYIKNHEFGHSMQNCIMGPLCPFIVGIPSAIRYWIYERNRRLGKENFDYYSVWFEATASDWGTRFMEYWEGK